MIRPPPRSTLFPLHDALPISRAALAAYSDGIVETLVNARSALRKGAPILIVVNDRRDLYPDILERAGLRLEERLRRHVNRRRSEEHTSELQSQSNLVCRLLLE